MIVFALVIRTAEFLFYHLLLSAVDRVSRLPRDTTIPEAMRLHRENIALKAQLDLLCRRLALDVEELDPIDANGAHVGLLAAGFHVVAPLHAR